MSNQYNIDDVVYLTESARVGSLESYKVSGVRQDTSGLWYYKISIPSRIPGGGSTYGDRNTLRQDLDFELVESELTTYCNAINIAISVMEAGLARLVSLRDQQCSESNS